MEWWNDEMESQRLRRLAESKIELGSALDTGYCAVQQVKNFLLFPLYFIAQLRVYIAENYFYG